VRRKRKRDEQVNALYWLIAIPFGLILAGLATEAVEKVARFHRAGMERVKNMK
jgi:hypothetical protein